MPCKEAVKTDKINKSNVFGGMCELGSSKRVSQVRDLQTASIRDSNLVDL